MVSQTWDAMLPPVRLTAETGEPPLVWTVQLANLDPEATLGRAGCGVWGIASEGDATSHRYLG